MDDKEKYVTKLILSMVKHGLIAFVNTASSALALGPYGFIIGPALSAAIMYFDRGTEEEQAKSLPTMSKNEIVKLGLKIAAKLAIENYQLIIKICKDIINILKRLFENKVESLEKIRSVVRYTPYV